MKVQPIVFATICMLLVGGSLARAEDPPANKGEYVSKAEYNQLKEDLDALKSEIRTMKANAAKPSEDTTAYLEEIQKQLDAVHDMAMANKPGTTGFLLTGYAYATYMDRRGSNNTFSAGINPIILWQVNDKLLVQTEIEIVLPQGNPDEPADSTSEGEFNLEYANVSYLLNDSVTLGAGKFLTPFGFFSEHIHPMWINKMPDKPLPYNEDAGLIPYQQLGFFVSGGVPIGENSKVKYDFFVSNGPTLRTDTIAGDPSELGTLSATNNGDLNNNKAVGGRVGILLFPQLEVDYSFLNSQVSPDGSQKVNALLQAVSLNYKQDIERLSGTLGVMAEYVWWNMGSATYDDGGTMGGPYTFKNDRSGGYVQVSYRPSMVNNKVIKNLEGIFRYDFVNEPSDAPERHDEDRYTLGVDYWLNPHTVVKVAYEIDNVHGAEDHNAFMLQTAIGF